MCTLLTIAAIGAFAFLTIWLDILNEIQWSIDTRRETDYFMASDQFPHKGSHAEMSAHFAYGVVVNGDKDGFLPASIGTVHAYHRKWDFTSSPDITYEVIPSHACTMDELGLIPAPAGRRMLDGHGKMGTFFEPRDQSSRKFLEMYQL